MVGEQGYHYLGLLPVLHRAPAHDTDRTDENNIGAGFQLG
jgi:hypothetical protein